MSKALYTFSGQFGDVMWSLCTVHELWKRRGKEKVDFAVMPQYRSLVPLIQAQPYVENAFVLEDWITTGSPFGCQPWNPPTIPANGYEEVRHLTYRFHPQGECLADAIARQQMIKLPDVCSPFIYVPEDFTIKSFADTYTLSAEIEKPWIAFGFNWMAAEKKQAFAEKMFEALADKACFLRVDTYDWLSAAYIIQNAKFFLGCRSANYVLAHGLGKKVLVYEPAGERRPSTYGFRCGTEVMPEINDLDAFVQTAESWLQ
jgi:hypothetical protein